MASKVVSTKLSIDEHGKLLEICKQNNSTPSATIKKLILNMIFGKTEIPTSGQPSQKQISTLTKPTIEQPPVAKPTIEQPPVTKPTIEQPPVAKPTIEQPPVTKPTTNINFDSQPIILQTIRRVEQNQLSQDALHELYITLSEKYDRTRLTKSEEELFRKVHHQLQHGPSVQNDKKHMSFEERVQYF